MDPFDKLPAELRLSILIHTRSKWSVSSLTRASPAMLRQYHTHERYIARSLIAADFDDEMVQDAMAIIFIQNSSELQGQDLSGRDPGFLSENLTPPNMRLLNTFYINPEIYASDMGQLGRVRAGYVIKNENKVEGSLARFGLGPLIEFLSHDTSDVRDRQALKERLRTWYIQDYEYSYKSGILCSTESITSRASPIYSQLSSEVDTELQRNIYRQRAWAFFDHRRLYPKRISRLGLKAGLTIQAKPELCGAHNVGMMSYVLAQILTMQQGSNSYLIELVLAGQGVIF
ncbi:hypothetical protein FMUND_15038 [Fusarium mundagurra]|uniref:Uncharacterized protein n=1 Tax=Fusarium mundagurra TaxID=1567541 RepID=A0A8H6D055_9HYPO|nr:hypothetical protein FMUND_15038 [Fusarium mundagurra]